MELLEHFTEESSDVIIFTLKESDREAFIKKLPSHYIGCYISENDLNSRVSTFKSSREKELSEILPSQGNIRSGDFGEILSYFLAKERYKSKNVDGAKKWQWKQEKNVAAPYTDVILYSINDLENPAKEDLLLSVESKMKATASNTYRPIQDAMAGAEKDYVSRIAHSLSWLRKKYKDESLKVGVNKEILVKLVREVERFINSETTGEYTKEVTALAVVDGTFLDDELAFPRVLPNLNGTTFQVYVVSISDLKNIYETVFLEIEKL